MSDYTVLVEDIIQSVKDTPFVFDLIDHPIVINAQDIFDVTSFQEDLVEAFKRECLNIDPQEVIDIINLDECEPVQDNWEDIDDEEDIFCLGNGTKQLNCKPSTKLPSFTEKILYDPYKGSGRLISPTTKTWTTQERPKTPLTFEDPEDISYPPTPTTPEPPAYKESFENFITNGTLREDGRFKGVLPIPIQRLFSIKVGEAIHLQMKRLKEGGFEIAIKPKTPPVDKKHHICKHGSSCKHHLHGHCIYAHSIDEWTPGVCQHGEHCWRWGKASGFKNTCKWWHSEDETKIDYYRRTQNKK